MRRRAIVRNVRKSLGALLPTAAVFVVGGTAAGALGACGPEAREGSGGGPDAAAACIAVARLETNCTDGIDQDCDGVTDCGDPDCDGLVECEAVNNECEVETPSVSFPLPDGICTTDLDPTDPRFTDYCSAYEGMMNLSGFAAGATLDDPRKLIAICVTAEHTWLRDLEIEAHCPDGRKIALSDFAGRTGGEMYFGHAIDNDEGQMRPGVGYEYCWRQGAANPAMITYANSSGPFEDYAGRKVLPAGDYQPSQPFTGLQGCPLNGPWKLRVIDAWMHDNGFIFGSRMIFDSSLATDCPVVD